MGLMQGFFFELCNIFNSYAPDASAVVKSKSRKEYIFERFYESLVQSYQSERSVKFYADQLCLTPKHLSGVVNEGTLEFFEHEHTGDSRPFKLCQPVVLR